MIVLQRGMGGGLRKVRRSRECVAWGGDKILWVPFDLDRWIKWNQPHKLVVLWLDIINGTTSNPKSCLCCSLEGVNFLRIIFFKII